MSDTENNSLEPAFSVSEFSLIVKNHIEDHFQKIDIEGEISNLSQSATGHWYFSLADEQASISTCLFRNDALRNIVIQNLKNGDFVRITAEISFYPKKSSLQLIVKKIILTSKKLGPRQQYELLKKKFTAEGLFDLKHKKMLPPYPKKIVVIAAEQSAALADFIAIFRRRSFTGEVIIIPSLVQGEKAPVSLLSALEQAQVIPDLDAIIFARGGGSFDDLMCFNHEAIVRAVFASKTVVISAIGHEIDFTLLDYVADYRMETPSASAEFITEWQVKIINTMESLRKTLFLRGQGYLHQLQIINQKYAPEKVFQLLLQNIHSWRQKLFLWEPKINILERRLYQLRLRLEEIMSHLLKLIQTKQSFYVDYIIKIQGLLDGVNPTKVLQRGYALVYAKDKMITSKEMMAKNHEHAELKIKFYDGEFVIKKE